MKIYRTKEVIINPHTMKIQLVEYFLWAKFDGVIYTTFEQLFDNTEEDAYEEMTDSLIELLDEGILKETVMGMKLLDSNKAHVFAGFFTEDTLHLVPPNEELCLADRTAEILENNDFDDAVDFIAASVGIK